MELVYPGIGMIFWMVVIFAILLFILGKFAWKPIMNSLHERENSIGEALKSADKAREEMKKLQADNEKLLQEAREERDSMLKEAKARKDEIIGEAKAGAEQERQKIIDAARQDIRNEKDAAIKDLKEQVAGFSIEIAEKILKEKLADEKDQKKLVEKYMDDIKFN